MYSGLLYVFKGGLGILQMLLWRYIPLLKDSRLGERAIVWGKLFHPEIVIGKKENLYKSLLVWIYVRHEYACQTEIA